MSRARKVALNKNDKSGLPKKTQLKDKEKNDKKRRSEPKKDNALDKVVKFFRGAFNELKKVHWPGRSELITYTWVVLVSVAIVAVLIWIIDFIFTYLIELII